MATAQSNDEASGRDHGSVRSVRVAALAMRDVARGCEDALSWI
jgi:hypothetical protein